MGSVRALSDYALDSRSGRLDEIRMANALDVAGAIINDAVAALAS